MSWQVKFQAQHTLTDPGTGAVILEAGELLDPTDDLIVAEPRSFKPVAVEEELGEELLKLAKEDQDATEPPSEDEAGLPKGNASREEWEAYALATGYAAEDLAELGRDEIRDLYA